MEKENALCTYESIIVIDPSLSLSDQKLFFQEIKKIIEQFQGVIHHIDTWGVRKLANQNKKKLNQGRYFHFSFQSHCGAIAELLRRIQIHDSVIYHHFEKLSSKKTLEEHLQNFRQIIEESIKTDLLSLNKRESILRRKKWGFEFNEGDFTKRCKKFRTSWRYCLGKKRICPLFLVSQEISDDFHKRTASGSKTPTNNY